MDWKNLIKHGLMKYGLIKHGLMKRGLIKHGLVKLYKTCINETMDW